MTGEGGTLERGRQRPSVRPGREPPDQEPRVERVAGAGRVGRRDRLRGDLETQPRLALTRQDRRALEPRFTTAIPARSSRPSTAYRPRSPSASEAVANRMSGATSSIRARAARRPRESKGPIDARSTLTTAFAPRASLDPPAPRQAQRLVDERIQRQVERVSSGEPRRLEIAWLELERSPSVGDEGPLAVGVTRTPILPVRAPATRTTRGVTPSLRTASTSALPAASRPIAATSDDRAPSRPSQRAAVAADPPWAKKTRPGTSVPCSSDRSDLARRRRRDRRGPRSAASLTVGGTLLAAGVASA